MAGNRSIPLLSVSRNTRGWHWLTVLSLDAPLVALVWQDFFARSFAASLLPAHRVVLGFSVWLAYVADRWLDGRQLPGGAAITLRHDFARRFARPIAIAWVFVLTGNVLLALVELSREEFLAGLGLAAAVFAYLAAGHKRPILQRFGWLKEFSVALLISVGAVFFVFLQTSQLTVGHWVGLGLLILLCFLNCAVVSVWEKDVDQCQAQPSLAIRFGVTQSHLMAFAGLLLLLQIGIGLLAREAPLRWVAFAGSCSAAGILALLSQAGSIGLETRRLLVDAALLSPLGFIWFL